jgi:hypothetical protein
MLFNSQALQIQGGAERVVLWYNRLVQTQKLEMQVSSARLKSLKITTALIGRVKQNTTCIPES